MSRDEDKSLRFIFHSMNLDNFRWLGLDGYDDRIYRSFNRRHATVSTWVQTAFVLKKCSKMELVTAKVLTLFNIISPTASRSSKLTKLF